MVKKIVGISLIGLGIFLEVLWLGFCFGTVLIGLLLLFFAPQILFFPFTFFLTLGLVFLKSPNHMHYNNNYYSQDRYKNSYANDNKHTSKIENLDKYYKILGSTSNDEFSTIKHNYKKLIKEYHYDTISSKNLPQAMLQFAENKTKELNEAYAKIKEFKNDEDI